MTGTSDRSQYPQFSEAEFERRYERVRRLMTDRGMDAVVVFGWSAMGRAAQADVHYLSGYLGMRDNYVTMPAEGEPVLFAQSYNHVPNAAVASSLDDVRWGGVDSGRTVGAELVRLDARRVGVVGWMPYQHHESMRAAAPGVTFTDLTGEFRRLRVDKSEEELEWLMRGAAFTDAALEALGSGLRPGIREFELAGVIEQAYLADGGLTTFYYLASTPMSAPDRCVPAQVLSDRVIEAGDVVSTEISISYGGYAGQGLRTYVVAADPTPEVAGLHEVAVEVYRRVAAAIRPGATHEDVWAAADPIDERGYSIRDDLVHGFGIGILPPAIRTRQTTHREDPWTFAKGQTLVIQPNVITADERIGVQTGDLCVVTADGARSLHHTPLELRRV
ncbi:MAG: M24 family metallopeptidase [Acidimicrobiales bacterium]